MKHFKSTHAILPVVHVQDRLQAITQSSLAKSAGADGVFLIGHSMQAKDLMACATAVRETLPGFWLGINFLDLTPKHAFEFLDRAAREGTIINGLWTDTASRETDALRACSPDLAYFGGTAFKYQRQPEDLEAAAREASLCMDFVTTSGPGTGLAVSLSKMQAMKQGVGSRSLAIASGITPENVVDYLPYADAYLVATGISRNFREFDEAKLNRLVENVRNWKS